MSEPVFKVRYSYLPQQFGDVDDLFEELKGFVPSGDFTLGEPLARFEEKFADLIGAKYAFGVGSGTDALKLGLKAVGVGHGDEVITAANTFIASVGAINELGAKPVFVDVDDSFCMDVAQVEAAITAKTKAILPVQLTGEIVDMPALMAIAEAHDIPVVEDACQGILAAAPGPDRALKNAGTWGVAGGFSLHPLKNLNVWGDGGVVVTSDDDVANQLKLLRNHGMRNRDEIELLGYNSLESALVERCGSGHAVALGSGTDALILGLIAAGLRPGDDVITSPNSFVASTAAIVHAGGNPVFVEVGPDQNMDAGRIEAAITPRTTAILPVHLTGRIAEMDAINEIAALHGIFVIEDAAQSVGSTYHGKASGSLGTLGCFSTHPLKNLGGAGDGGFVTTDDPDIAKTLMELRNHGLEGRDTVTRWGFVSRMDTLQAAILLHRLGRLDDVIAARRTNAGRYRQLLDPAFFLCRPSARKPATASTPSSSRSIAGTNYRLTWAGGGSRH